MNQAELNYADDAQRRISADTLCYQKKATLVMPTTGTVTLPTDLIRIEGLFNGVTPVQHSKADDVLRFLSAGLGAGSTTACVIGRTLYMLPTPTTAQTLTLIYKARTPQFTPDVEFTLTGEYESLIDELVVGMVLIDQGETNVGVAQMAAYEQRAGNLRRRAGAKPGGSGRVRRVGQRNRPLL